jgi:hypothetical protein
MSVFWSTIIGAAAAIVGGLGAALWQTRRADDIARRIRREERREQALFAFADKISEVQARLRTIYRTVETSPLTTQYDDASEDLIELARLYLTRWGTVIYDIPIRETVGALIDRVGELLPPGAVASQYTESEPAARAAHFARDLQELLALTDILAQQVLKETVGLGGLPE